MGFTVVSGYSKAEISPTTPSAPAISGSGGGVMPVWHTSKSNKYNTIFSGTYTNKSEFAVPPTINGESGFSSSSVKNGYGAEANMYKPDGLPLTGTASLNNQGTTLNAVAGTEYITVAYAPTDLITKGADQASSITLDFAFDPELAGLSLTKNGISTPSYSTGVTIYGAVEGKITDAANNPVTGVTVSGSGAGTTTSDFGNYSILGPGGSSVTLTSLNGSATKTVNLNSGSKTTVNWQFAGVKVSVRLPGGIPARGAKVKNTITGDTLVADSKGNVFFKQLPINSSGNLLYFDEISESLSTGGQGAITHKSKTVGVGIHGTVRAKKTQNRISDVTVRIQGTSQFEAQTDSSGEYAVGTYETGKLTLEVAPDSLRFIETDIDLDLAQGDLKEEDVDLLYELDSGTVR